jgi:hypothetical protein
VSIRLRPLSTAREAMMTNLRGWRHSSSEGSGLQPIRCAERLDVSSFAAEDACAVFQPLSANIRPCRAGSPEAASAYPSGRRRTEGAALGRIACTVNGVGREAGVDPRLLIDYFLQESLGLTNIVKAIQSAPGLRRLRPVLKEGEPWRKDHSQARLRLRRALSAR